MVDDKTFEEGKLPAILSYWFWPAAFVLKGKNSFANYHARHGFAYFIFALIVWMATCGITFGGGFVLASIVGGFIWFPLLALHLVVFAVFGFITIKGTLNVLERKEVPPPILERIPFLGEIAKKVEPASTGA